MVVINHSPKASGSYLLLCCAQLKFFPMTKPDRLVGKHVNAWLDEMDKKGVQLVSSHWAFHPDTYFKRTGRDYYVHLERDMADTTMSLYDYLRGPEWLIRLGRRGAHEAINEVFHWRWQSLCKTLLDANDFGRWLDTHGSAGIPNLSRIRPHRFDLVIDADAVEPGLAELSEVIGREIEPLPFLVNETRDTTWREKYVDQVRELIYEEPYLA